MFKTGYNIFMCVKILRKEQSDAWLYYRCVSEHK